MSITVIAGDGIRLCPHCASPMLRKTWANGEPETVTQYQRRKYCSKDCAAAARIAEVRTRTSKRCPRCKAERPVEAFRPNKARPDGRAGLCRPCENKSEAEWRRTTDKGLAMQRRSHRRYKYGLEPSDYDAMAEAQGGVCAICEQPESIVGARGVPKSLSIDHNHITGVTRGLLCQRCNQGIGNMKENPARLRAAADYLERWGA